MILRLLFQIILLLWGTNASAQLQPSPRLRKSNCKSVSLRLSFEVDACCGIDNWFETDYISDTSGFAKSFNLEVFEFSLSQERRGYVVRHCQTRILPDFKKFNLPDGEDGRQQECKYAYFLNRDWYDNITKTQRNKELCDIPRVLGWKPNNFSFLLLATDATTSISKFPMKWKCNEKDSRLGIEEDVNGSKDPKSPFCRSSICKSLIGRYMLCENRLISVISIGVGGLVLLIGRRWLCTTITKSKKIKLKENFFKQNGGLLLQQLLNSYDSSVERFELFNSIELDKATDNFNMKRILGQGGQGTVYKGMLENGRVIAVKESKLVDERKLEEFINEVVILSQINHMNVVKLLGCCLETVVPLLVYEFIPNGTLFQYIHNQSEEFSLTWDRRLQIAIEVARALSYLHSGASFSIFHRDIKSTNILLDANYRAKVADFGTSRPIAIDQTHKSTIVLGTFGYLDPEYLQSSRFTDKSDVYSFGVVLLELLTGKKPILEQQNVSLAAYFMHSIKEKCLYEILDVQVKQQGKRDEIMEFANLAKNCLNRNGKERPAMKEVVMVLEGIRTSKKKGLPFGKIMKRLNMREHL